jgi:hypothetical protein
VGGIRRDGAFAWLVPLIVLVLAAEYHAIVRWEEELLATRLGDSYRQYLTRVPRWLPSWTTAAAHSNHGDLFVADRRCSAERGT